MPQNAQKSPDLPSLDHANYALSFDAEQFRIFPKTKNDETIPVTIYRKHLNLQHKLSGEIVQFKYYYHRGQWKWKDMRETGPTSCRAIIGEVGRMLVLNSNEAAIVVEHLRRFQPEE